MILAVTGITGHSGSFFLQELIRNKFDGTLRCLVRESSDTSALDASGLKVEKVVGSSKNADDLFRLVNGADRIMHIAGIWDTLPLLEAADRAQVKGHIVLVHSTGIYSRFRMANKDFKKTEKIVKDYADAGMYITIIRPTIIFGDMRDRHFHEYIVMVDKLPLMPQVHGGRTLVQPVNARDLGRAYYQCLMTDGLPEFEYVVSGSRRLSLREMCSLIGIYLGKKTRFINVPSAAVVGSMWCVKQLTAGKIDYVEKALRLSEDRVFSHEAATRDFGYEPEPFEIGLKREVEEYLHGKA